MGWVVMGLLAASGAVGVLNACSNSSGTTDAGAEGGVPTCGTAPYANVNARVTSLTTGLPLEGVTVTADPGPCAAFQATTDTNGVAAVRIQLNTPVNARVQQAGYLTERAGEAVYKGDFDGGAFMVPTVVAGALPHYSATTPDILTIIYGGSPDAGSADSGAPPCTSVSGATFSVVGHPEAVITYYQPPVDGGLPTPDTTLTGTTSIGAAEISGLTAGQTVQLQVTTPNCSTAGYASYPLTGKFYLENNVLTLAPAFLVPTP